jgi:hypothetical protein
LYLPVACGAHLLLSPLACVLPSFLPSFAPSPAAVPLPYSTLVVAPFNLCVVATILRGLLHDASFWLMIL